MTDETDDLNITIINGWALPERDSHFAEMENIGAYQQEQRNYAYGFVKNWRRAVDVGAHIGTFSKDFAGRFETVISFEPDETCRECLCRNVAEEYKNVFVNKFALSFRSGLMGFGPRNLPNSGDNAVKPLEDGGLAVKARSLDSFGFTDVDLLKIDVQGHEPEVLMGSIQTIKASTPVIMIEEKSDPTLPEAQKDKHIKRVGTILRKLGYKKADRVGADRIWIPAEK